MGNAILPILGGIAGIATGGLALPAALGLGGAAAGAGAATGAAAGAAGLGDAAATAGALGAGAAGAGAAADAAGSGFNLGSTLQGLGQVAGGGAQLSKALYDKPNPQMPGYSGSHSQIPMVNVKQYLQPVGGGSNGSPVPTLGSFRDNSLTHILGQLGSGVDNGDF